LLKLNSIYKKFGDNEVLKGVDLQIEEGEVVSIIGPSGTGKSTLLRCINCLEKVESGNITIDNKKLDLASLKKEESEKKALKILEQVGLLEKKDKYPSSLSGGQQQRIAIGRALALEPKIILFDEPTSALDPELVNEVLLIIEQLAKQKITMLIVTHEINFARNISDKVCFMSDGKIIEQGCPKSVIDNPKHDRTRQFLNKLQKR